MSTQFDELDSLAEIDPAPAPDPRAHTDPAAQQLLHTILASAQAPDVTTGTSRPRRSLRPWLLAGAAAAVAAAAVVIPTITADQAYSSWTSIPAALSGPDLHAAAQECQGFWQDTGLLADADLTAEADLAEQRGDFRYVLMSTPTHHLDCLIRADEGPGGAGYWAGSASEHRAGDMPAPDGLTAVSVALVERDDVALLFLHARVGEEVQEAVAHIPGHGDVHATVQGGYLAAWAPEVNPGELEEGIGVTLTLAEGDSRQFSPDEVREAQTDQ